MPKVSVIVPVYNVEVYLRKCLDSLISQTLEDIEIICVNDGSTDNSPQILEEYSKKDSRIKVIHKENGGLSSARNKGLEVAVGEFIGFVDSDDWIEPQAYETAIYYMKNDIDIVVWNAKIIILEPDKYSPSVNYYKLPYKGALELNNESAFIPVIAWNKLFKKEIIDKYNIRFPEGLIFEDNAFHFNYILLCRKIYFIDEYLYNHLIHKNSIMGKVLKKASPKVFDWLLCAENIYNFWKQHNLINQNKDLYTKIFLAMLYDSYYFARKEDKKKVLEKASELAQKIDFEDIENNKIFKSLKEKKYYKIPALLVYIICSRLKLDAHKIINFIRKIKKIYKTRV